VQILKELKGELEAKVRKMQESHDESVWDMRQMLVEREKEVRKIRENGENIVEDLMAKYKIEMNEYKDKIQ